MIDKFLNIEIEEPPIELQLSVEMRIREVLKSDDWQLLILEHPNPNAVDEQDQLEIDLIFFFQHGLVYLNE